MCFSVGMPAGHAELASSCTQRGFGFKAEASKKAASKAQPWDVEPAGGLTLQVISEVQPFGHSGWPSQVCAGMVMYVASMGVTDPEDGAAKGQAD